MKASNLIIILGSFFITAAGPWYGQEAKADSDLAKKTGNPVSDLISLPFQNNTNFGVGPDNETQNILFIQPVWPISLDENWNLVTRTILPVISQPGLLPEQDRTNGLGDTTFTAFLSPKDSGKLTWGARDRYFYSPPQPTTLWVRTSGAPGPR